MSKTSCGLAIAALLIAVFSGFGPGCNSTSNATGAIPCYFATPIPDYRPPVHYAGKCTSGQISEFIADCMSVNTATQAVCDNFYAQSVNSDCGNNCLAIQIPDPNNPPANYGALLELYYINLPGYLSLIGGSAACVSAYHAYYECSIRSCDTCPQDGLSPQACYNQVAASGGGCEGQLNTYNTACADAVQQGLLTQASASVATDTALAGVLNVFCGTPSGDGGTDGGDDGGSDSSTDASSDAGAIDAGADADAGGH
ncbi:MAG TPA: hypothetical protein VNO21_00370 [Polyangiaceae bacterium]|nr:hypothetical protein [Polyangiaceae bacterium]